LATVQLEAHQKRLDEYELLRKDLAAAGVEEGPRLTLDCGIDHERVFVRYWKRLAGRDGDG
jgi:hypothetical protein